MRRTIGWARVTNTRWKRVVVVVGIVVGIPLVAWGTVEYAYQARVQNLVRALNQVGQDELKPIGGINQRLAGVSGHCRHAIDLLAIDTGPCPRVSSDWLVPVEPGKEASFLMDILSKEGYSVHVGAQSDYKSGYPLQAGGTKDGVGLNMELIINTSNRPSGAASEGKQWLQLGVTALEVHR